MVATAVTEEFQVTDEVRSWVELSLNVPVALNCCCLPSATDGFSGLTVIETKPVATVKIPPCAVEPPTVTERGPVVAPTGTVTTN